MQFDISQPGANGNAGNRRREVHDAICATCGASTTVPFVPQADRPVYCSDCFRSRRQQDPRTEQTTHSQEEQTRHCDVFPEMTLMPSTRAAIAGMGITAPKPIQTATISTLQAGHDVIGQARTGSGKTLAFAVPMIEQCEPSRQAVQALVLVPTRELAIQVASVTQELAERQQLTVMLLYGGRSLAPEVKALRGGAQVVIGTPGRTLDHIRRGSLVLKDLKVFVLDEADEMLDRGFAHDVEAILAATPRERQTALFSATMPDWVAKTAHKHLRDPQTVAVDADVQVPPEIEHIAYEIDKAQKLDALRTLLDRHGGPILVFGRTKHGVKKLAKQLAGFDYPVDALHGNLSQNARERVMERFRSGKVPILVATNVAARGLDIQGIDQVINFDLPDAELLFTHRTGRTGRMGRHGEAITFITPEDSKKWREIERALGHRFPLQAWPGSKNGSARSELINAETRPQGNGRNGGNGTQRPASPARSRRRLVGREPREPDARRDG